MTKRGGSGSESQCTDPDPYQIVTALQHCWSRYIKESGYILTDLVLKSPNQNGPMPDATRNISGFSSKSVPKMENGL